MKRGTIRIIIVLSSLLLMGLVVTQIFWVREAYRVTQKQTELNIIETLVGVAEEILEHNQDSAQLVDPVRMLSANSFTVSINDTLHPYYLESLLTNAFKKRELNLDFEYSIYDCFTDAVVYSKKVVNMDERAEILDTRPPDIPWEDDGHYFSVVFPTLGSMVLEQMGFWIFSSILLALVVCFYAYTLSVVLKQKRLSEVKNDFINNMTHELKTPISTISLSSDMLLQPNIADDPERLRNFATIIRNENHRLQKQVERVLQMATLDKEKIELRKKEVDLHEVLREAVLAVELKVKERGGTITLHLNATQTTLQVDPDYLTNVLHNLLDNANKYSPETPDITVTTTDSPNGLTISVKDCGIGMEKTYQKQVFDRFFRVPTGNRHDVKGFGLGLYYVRMIIQAHRGRVSVESEPGQGSQFTITLPRQ